jgi:hypothetical protein
MSWIGDGVRPYSGLVIGLASQPRTDALAAGELAGRAARAVAGGGRKIATAFDRVELISDALTAILAARSGFTVITEDADFDVLAQLVPGLQVLFYDRHGGG